MRTIITLAIAGCLCAPLWAQPLFDYIAAPDACFAWQKTTDSATNDGGALTRLEMTSQVWQGITWKHRIAVARPQVCQHPQTCLLFITGGDPVGQEFVLAMMVANQVGLPVAVLGDIPNQPLFDGLREDALISYTFNKVLETGDTTWPALYPMTKAAVRAMDALQQMSQQEWEDPIETFVIGGASKRGWTTWFTGQVDERVIGIVPMVYDNLNLAAQMQHQIRQWGAYSPQIDDYTSKGLPDFIGSEAGRRLADMVDPYTYRDRATMPKLIVAGTNDPYWPLGAANDYFADLVGPKHLLYAPNSGHGLDDRVRVIQGVAAFAAWRVGEIQFPQLRWELQGGEDGAGRIVAHSEPAPERVLLWTAKSDTGDFRPSKWVSEELEAQDGRYGCTVQAAEGSFAAAYLEFDYQLGDYPLPLCTQMQVVGPYPVEDRR